MFSGPAPRRLLSAVSIVLVMALAACADTRGGSIPYDKVLAAPDEVKFETLGTDYKIAPMDKLAVKVFKSQDLSGDYDVDLAGNISLPLIGEVEAANMTTAELDQKLTEKLSEKYLEHPDVSVAIKQSAGRLVTVDGAVKNSGSFPIPGSLSLMQAIALAQGPNEDANPHRVAIFRTIGGKRQAAAFDLVAIRRGQSQDPPVYPGDIVVVDGSSNKALQKKLLQSIPLLAIFGPI